MRKFISKFSRVADSSEYSLLRSESRSSSHPRRTLLSFKMGKQKPNSKVREGYIPVYVGEEMERFIISAEQLNHPILISLLNKSAQEYGYEQKGVLRIPCHVFVFERVLEALRIGGNSPDQFHDLLVILSDDLL